MKIKKKVWFIAGFYLLSFIVTLVLANYMLNYDRIHPSKNQGETSLIKLNVKQNGIRINEMDAYTQEMDAAYLRLSVTPISDTKKITLQMYEPVSSVEKISYVLMDENNEVEIESGVCPDVQRVEGERQTEITFTSDLKEGKEYCLNLTVEDDGGQAYYYYTRVAYGTNFQVYDKLQFVLDFHNATFSKSATMSLAEYLSYSSNANSSDFRQVSIYSDSETVTWGDLAPEGISDVDATILNLDRQTAEIQLVYEIRATDNEGNDYNYTVKEYFDVSTTGSNLSLIGYSRTMEEKLDDRSFVFDNSMLRLGLVNKEELDVHVYGKEEPEEEETNETGAAVETEAGEEEYNTYISFVADGSLWVYNTKDNVLTQAFGFERKNQTSYRDSSYLNHGVKVLRTEENGDLYFAVYGYMYNGDNEGRFGIQINQYNRVDGTYSEVLFIPYGKSFSMLEEGMQKMAFINEHGVMYFYLEDKIYRVDVITKEVGVALEDANNEDCVISEDGRTLVLSHRDESGQVSEIEWWNLETSESKTINANGRIIQMVGILGENLVYGASDAAFPDGRLGVLYVVDFHLNILKEYTVPGGHVSYAEVNGNVVEIWRRNNDYSSLPVDYILYNDQAHVDYTTDIWQELRMYETWLSTESYGNDMPLVLYARGVEAYRDTQIVFEMDNETDFGYYVSVDDTLTQCEEFKDAYQLAYETEGKILNHQGRLIMRPAVRDTSKGLNGPDMPMVGEENADQQKAVLEWLLTFEKQDGQPVMDTVSMYQNLQATFTDYEIVDLTGVPLNRALAMISNGMPLIVKNSEGTWCVAEGYGSGYIEIADPKDGTVVRYDSDSAIEGIASSGNVIYSYFR